MQLDGAGLNAMVAAIRTANPDVRAQQWARLTDLTGALADHVQQVRTLRSYLAAAKNFQSWTWQLGGEDTETLRMLEKRIRGGVDALKLATDGLSSIQSELMALQTALDDNYERTE